jgi:hypothetical protein
MRAFIVLEYSEEDGSVWTPNEMEIQRRNAIDAREREDAGEAGPAPEIPPDLRDAAPPPSNCN